MTKKQIRFSVLFLIFSGIQNAFAVTKIAYVTGFSSVPYAFMFSNNAPVQDAFIFEQFEDIKSASEAVVNRNADAVILSVKAAFLLCDSFSDRISCASVLQGTDFYLVTTNHNIKNLSDLLGKRVSCPKSGFQKDFISWILKKNDLPVGKGNGGVSMSWDSAPSFQLAGFLSGDNNYAFFSEPLLSDALKNSKTYRIAIDVQDEYNAIQGKNAILPKTVLIVNKSYASGQPDDLEILLESMKISVEKAVLNSGVAAQLCKKYKLTGDSILLSDSIRRGNFFYEEAENYQNEFKEVLKILNESDSSFASKNISLSEDFILKTEAKNIKESSF